MDGSDTPKEAYPEALAEKILHNWPKNQALMRIDVRDMIAKGIREALKEAKQEVTLHATSYRDVVGVLVQMIGE